MRSLGLHIRARRHALGLTLEALAERAGCTKGYLSAIETGRRGRPPSEPLLRRLETALGLETGTLLSEGWWASTPAEVRERLRGLERRTRAAAELAELVLREGRGRGVWSEELERLAARVSSAAGWSGGESGADAGAVGRAPVINTVEGGYPTFPDERFPWRAGLGHVAAPVELGTGAFAVRVVGGAMEPAYHEGDVVVVRPVERRRSGADCFVRLRDGLETTFRRVYFETGRDGARAARLQPLNPALAARVVPEETVTGVYEAAYVLRRAPGWDEASGAGARAEAEGAGGPEAGRRESSDRA